MLGHAMPYSVLSLYGRLVQTEVCVCFRKCEYVSTVNCVSLV